MDTGKTYDIGIIGGGINGCAIALDAIGRGLSVVLCEQNDFASGTSSKSSNLIHGGIRYLENYEFGLVRKALKEREILLKAAPHLMRPLQFILPHEKQLRPLWLMRLGLFIYDHLYFGSSLPHAQFINLQQQQQSGLKPAFKKAIAYYDCLTQDSRLVIENALKAEQLGAVMLNYHKIIDLEQHQDYWLVKVKNQFDGQIFNVKAKLLVNASGPWFNHNLEKLNLFSNYQADLIKGSHLVVPKLYSADNAYILQGFDRRIIFTIPYYDSYTLIGTTDVEIEKVSDAQKDLSIVSEEEKAYLCKMVNHYFNQQIDPLKDILWQFWGIRPIFDLEPNHKNPSAKSRDYKIELILKPNLAPLLNILGGKITTYRALAEQAISQVETLFPHQGKAWTQKSVLPGAEFSSSFTHYCTEIEKQFSFLPKRMIKRILLTYGSRTSQLLRQVNSIQDLGILFANHFSELEIEFLIKNEWCKKMDDLLWRRSKLGLECSAKEQNEISKNFHLE